MRRMKHLGTGVTSGLLARTLCDNCDDGLSESLREIRASGAAICAVSVWRPRAGGRYHLRDLPARLVHARSHSGTHGEELYLRGCKECSPRLAAARVAKSRSEERRVGTE